MSAIFRSLTQSPDLSDPRGYYVGRAAVRLETRTTSVVWSDDSLVAQPNILKVPARAFLRFWFSGARVQLTRSAVSIAHGEHFRAVLPGVDASHYCDDLQIREHHNISAEALRELVKQLRRARLYCATGTHNMFRHVYAGERWVFASNGQLAYFRQLRERLPCRLTLTPQAANQLTYFWALPSAEKVMVSPRSILVSGARMAMSVRCADALLPDHLYRKIRGVQMHRPFARVDKARLREAVQALHLSHATDAPILFHWLDGAIRLNAPVGYVWIKAEALRRCNRSGWVTMSALRQALDHLPGAKLLLGQSSQLSAHLTLSSCGRDYGVALPTRRQAEAMRPCWFAEPNVGERTPDNVAPRMLPTHEVVQTLSVEALADGLARACRGDAQARARLNGDDTESPDAFGRLTHALGLDADVLRAGVLHAMRMGTHPVASETPAERRLR